MPAVHYHSAYCIRSIWIVFMKGMVIRIFRVWRYLLLIFRAAGRTNYALEAFNLLAQEKFLLSVRLAKQLRWS